MVNALSPTRWFYSLFSHAPERQSKNEYPSRLEISFLLDSGASFSVPNYHTYLTIAIIPNIKGTDTTHNTSKTLTVANQTELPVLHNVTLT